MTAQGISDDVSRETRAGIGALAAISRSPLLMLDSGASGTARWAVRPTPTVSMGGSGYGRDLGSCARRCGRCSARPPGKRTFARVVVAAVAVACLLALPCGNASAAGTSGWSVQWLPVPSSAVTVPLSCSSSTACTAVAAYYPFPSSDRDVLFAVRWNGRSWSREVMAAPAGSNTLLVGGLSCPSGSWCVAVGGFTSSDHPSRYVPLVERWDGTEWSVEPVSTPAGGRLSSRLTSVSCTSPIACTAVGDSVSPRGTTPLVERWNGVAWSIERTTGGSLISVSCTSGLACTAVGHAGNQTLGEGWNGARWSIQPNPHPRRFEGPGVDNELGSVSCASRDACMAVGDSGSGSGFNTVRITLAEHWNGSHWSVLPTPNPVQLDEFNSVSCSSRGSCVAVGDYTDRAGDATLPLVERWHGGRWSVVPTPRSLSTGRSADPTLLAVACFPKGSCLAIGDAEGGPFSAQFSSNR